MVVASVISLTQVLAGSPGLVVMDWPTVKIELSATVTVPLVEFGLLPPALTLAVAVVVEFTAP